jgi:opine dehydrogenase
MNVTVVGAGNGGLALASDLLAMGHRVCLFSDCRHARHLDAIAARARVLSSQDEAEQRHCVLELTTTEAAEAAAFGTVLVFVLPSYAQEEVFRAFLPYLRAEHFLVFLPGNFFLVIAHQLLKEGPAVAALAEASSIPHICRADIPGEVTIRCHAKSGMHFSLECSAERWPSCETLLRGLFVFPIQVSDHPLSAGFHSINGVLHPIPVLLNLSLVESTDHPFYFYRDGMTDAVCSVMESLDGERRAIAESFGIALVPFYQQLASYYRLPSVSLRDFVRRSPAHNAAPHFPNSIHHRYILEDVPFVLNPWHQLAALKGTPAPLLSSVLTLFGAVGVCGIGFAGRTLTKEMLHDCGILLN